jgi:hypothetical protein
MSDHSKTSPLEQAARAAYNPSNRELMDELIRQNTKLDTIHVQTSLTNGRVDVLEVASVKVNKTIEPLTFFYNNIKLLLWAVVLVAPVLFKIMEIALDYIWPAK